MYEFIKTSECKKASLSNIFHFSFHLSVNILVSVMLYSSLRLLSSLLHQSSKKLRSLWLILLLVTFSWLHVWIFIYLTRNEEYVNELPSQPQATLLQTLPANWYYAPPPIFQQIERLTNPSWTFWKWAVSNKSQHNDFKLKWNSRFLFKKKKTASLGN